MLAEEILYRRKSRDINAEPQPVDIINREDAEML